MSVIIWCVTNWGIIMAENEKLKSKDADSYDRTDAFVSGVLH